MSWDDGKHTKVKRVQLTFDDAIRSIEVEYEGTSLKSQPRGTVGTKLDGFTLSSDEYITEMNGYSKTTFSGEVITSLTFKTNKKTYGTYGNKTSNYFSVSAPKDKQIAGFRGSSSHALNSIDAHFAPVPSPGNTGGTTETGSNPGSIESNTGGNGSNTGSPGTNTGNSETIGGPGTTGGNGSNTGSGTTGGPGTTGENGSNTGSGTIGGPGTTGGNGSNTGSGTTGGPGTTGSNGSNTGSETTGGSGTTGGNGSNAGSETTGGPGTTGGNGSNTGSGTTGGPGTNTGDSGNTGSGSNNNSSPQKLEAQGGKGGNQWDDGTDHDGVTKIHVAEGGLGIEKIKFDYVKNGESKEGPSHGVKGRGGISSFVINHPDEYLVSVEGWYDKSTNIIQGIQFKTNTKTSEYFGYDFFGEGPQFSLEVKDKKIIGFHGFSDSHLNSLGAYFVPVSSSSSSLTPPVNRVDAQGGNYGETFDDGAFDHVRKVYVGQGDSGVAYVKFDYEKDGKKETREHGKMSLLGTEEFEVDSGDYITSMDVYVDKVYGYKSEIIIALTFKTFKGKTSPRFGFETENKYELKDGKGGKLAGFHGKASDVLYAIGAYFVPVSSSSSSLTPPANKVDAQGGNYGETFDDGAFDHVRKVYVGEGDSGVAYVKFDYEKDGKKETREHGKMSLLGTEEFEVDSGDYITSMDVYVDKVYGYKSEIIIALTFKTFKGKTSPRFGFETENKYEVKDGKGGKLAGFHGKASDVLYAIGAYFAPVSSSSSSLTPPANKIDAQGGNYGETFDDGAFDHVRKVYVGQGESGVAYVKFDYEKDGKKETREHGKITLLGTEEFEVDSGDYITSIDVYVDKVYGYKSEIVIALTFKTFKGKTSQRFGFDTQNKYELKDGKGGKLAGFHGKASDVLYAIGAYFTPIAN